MIVNETTKTCQWNGDVAWQSWQLNKKEDELTVQQYSESNPEHLDRESRRVFYEQFYENELKSTFGSLITELCEKYYLSRQDLQMEGETSDQGSEEQKGEMKERKGEMKCILPSFFKLLEHLLDEGRRFNVIIRTFGSERRVKQLCAELNEFFLTHETQTQQSHTKHRSFSIEFDNQQQTLSLQSMEDADPAIHQPKLKLKSRSRSKSKSSGVHEARLLTEKQVGAIYRDNKGPFLSLGHPARPPIAYEWGSNIFTKKHAPVLKKKREAALKVSDSMSSSKPSSEQSTEEDSASPLFHVSHEEDERDGRQFYAEEQQKRPEEVAIFEGIEHIYNKFRECSLHQETLIIRDDFPWWQANRYEYHAGKPLLVDCDDFDIHPILFDDNIWPHMGNAKIVDVIDITNHMKVSFEKAHEVFIMAANPLLAVYDDQYFIKAVQQCERNRQILSRKMKTK